MEFNIPSLPGVRSTAVKSYPRVCSQHTGGVAQTPHHPPKAKTMNIEERLEKLERELFAEKRRNRWLLVAVGLGVVGVGLVWTLATIRPTAQAQGANIGPKVIRANQLILEDETGKIRAGLNVGKDGPGLSLFDETGKVI